MSEDKQPIEPTAKAPAVEKTEERTTGEMTAATVSEADAPKIPEAKASPTEASPSKAESKPAPEAKAESKPASEAKAESKPAPEAKAESKPESKPEPEPEPVRASRATVTMPVVAPVGAPPDVPGDVESPTHMPGPNDVPSGAPTDAAKAPGHVPSGDSRSLRRGGDFALIYRQGSAVITRFGAVGQRGQWRVVEYPTPSSASNAYAKECSRFVGEGFSDYRD